MSYLHIATLHLKTVELTVYSHFFVHKRTNNPTRWTCFLSDLWMFTFFVAFFYVVAQESTCPVCLKSTHWMFFFSLSLHLIEFVLSFSLRVQFVSASICRISVQDVKKCCVGRVDFSLCAGTLFHDEFGSFTLFFVETVCCGGCRLWCCWATLQRKAVYSWFNEFNDVKEANKTGEMCVSLIRYSSQSS